MSDPMDPGEGPDSDDVEFALDDELEDLLLDPDATGDDAGWGDGLVLDSDDPPFPGTGSEPGWDDGL